MGVLAGCSGNGNGNGNDNTSSEASPSASATVSSRNPVKLTMWGGIPPESGPQAVVDTWNAEHPDIQVEYVRFVNDDEGNLKPDTAMMTGQDFDLFVNYMISQASKLTRLYRQRTACRGNTSHIPERAHPSLLEAGF